MLYNYIKIAFRNLYRNKSYTIINIIGLGTAMALCVVGYINYQFSQSFDSFHKNADDIYLVGSSFTVSDRNLEWLYAPLPMAPAIAEANPAVKGACRVSCYGGVVGRGDRIFQESIFFVDKNFFDIFTFPLIAGSSSALSKQNEIIITDEIAKKYFGDENPIGQELVLNMDGEHEHIYTVAGIVKNPPLNSTLFLRLILPYDAINVLRGTDLNSWNEWADATFLQIDDKSESAAVTGGLQNYLDLTNQSSPNFKFTRFALIPLRQVASVSRSIANFPFNTGLHPTAIIAPSIVALLALLLACLNFVNTGVAFAASRLKEIGIRKVIGGVRSQLILQFLGENIILCFLSLIAACLLAEIFVPAYSNLWPELSLTLNYTDNWGFLAFMGILLLCTAIGAGLYPAVYISSFRPAAILKQRQKIGGTNKIIKVLLTFQIALSITAIISAVIMNQNAAFIKNLDHGFTRENIYCVRINEEGQYTLLKDAIKNNPDILNIGATRQLMTRFVSEVSAESGHTKSTIHLFRLGDGFFQTVNFDLIDGRVFDSRIASDIEDAAIVNQRFLREFGWTNAIDREFKLVFGDSIKTCRVIGVVRDFYPNGVELEIRPTVLQLTSPDNYRYLAVKSNKDKGDHVSAYIEKSWKNLFPDVPFRGFWLDEDTEEVRTNTSIRLVFIYVAGVVMIISCMGLFALISLNIARRTKEIGIRKVLGATLLNIGKLISKEFIIIFIISSIIAGILSYFLMNTFLGSIWTYYTDIGPIPFIIGPIFALLATMLTAIYRIYSAAKANPVDTLRYE